MKKPGARSQYLKLIDERIGDTNVAMLIEWLRDLDRKPAVLSFTEGPARQLAYAIEAALKLERETYRFPLPLPPPPPEEHGATHAMPIDEALGYADEWIQGVTLYKGAQGWRVVCARLAAEVRRLRYHLGELGKAADAAAMVIATVEAEDTTEEEGLQRIMDAIGQWAPDAMLGRPVG